MGRDVDTYPTDANYRPKPSVLKTAPAAAGAVAPYTPPPTELGIGEPLSAPSSLGPDPNPERAPANGAEWVTLAAKVDGAITRKRYHSVRDSALIRQYTALPFVVVESREPASMMTEAGARAAGHADSTAAAGWETLTPQQRRMHAAGAALPMLASIPAQFIPGSGWIPAAGRVGLGMASAAATTPISAAMQEREMNKGEPIGNAVMAGALPAVFETGMAVAPRLGRWMTNRSFDGVPKTVVDAHRDAVWRELPLGSPRPAAHEARLGDFGLENDLPMPGPDFRGRNAGVAGSTQTQAKIEAALARRNRVLNRLGVRIESADWATDPNRTPGTPYSYLGDHVLDLLERVEGHQRKTPGLYDQQILSVLRNKKLAKWVPPTGPQDPGHWEMIPKSPAELQALVTEWSDIARNLQRSGANYRSASREIAVYDALAADAREYLRSLTPPAKPRAMGRLQAENQNASRLIPYRAALEHIEGASSTADAPLSAPALGVVTGVAGKNPATAVAGAAATGAAKTLSIPRIQSRVGRALYKLGGKRGQIARMIASSTGNAGLAGLFGVGEGSKTRRWRSAAADSSRRQSR